MLTTTEAPFIEKARVSGDLYIRQPYELYSAENHQAWNKLYTRMTPRWEKYANQHFLAGIQSICLNPDRVPSARECVNRFLPGPLHRFHCEGRQRLYIPAISLLY